MMLRVRARVRVTLMVCLDLVMVSDNCLDCRERSINSHFFDDLDSPSAASLLHLYLKTTMILVTSFFENTSTCQF